MYFINIIVNNDEINPLKIVFLKEYFHFQSISQEIKNYFEKNQDFKNFNLLEIYNVICNIYEKT